MTFPTDFSNQGWATAMLRASASYTEASYALANAWRNGVRQAVEGAAAHRKAMGHGVAHDGAGAAVHVWQQAHRQAEGWIVQSADIAARGTVALADNAAHMTQQGVDAALAHVEIARDPLQRALAATGGAFCLAWAQALAQQAEHALAGARRLEASVTRDAEVIDLFAKPAVHAALQRQR